MIVKLIAVLATVTTYIFYVPVAYAHLANQTPFFKINNIYTPLYPVSPDFNTDVVLPQDIGAENYLINEEIVMELDPATIPVVPQILNQVSFAWDFGDGTKGDGIKTTHAYQKPGSYLVVIMAQYGADPPQLMQSTLINILPDRNYQLPKAVIRVNGQESNNNPQNRIKLNFGQQVELDGQLSQAQSSKVVSYEWNLDNTETSKEVVTSVTFHPELDRLYPVLKIIDENGFIAYGIVGLENGGFFAQNPIGFITNRALDKQPLPVKLGIGIIILLVIYVVVFGTAKLLRNKKTKKYSDE